MDLHEQTMEEAHRAHDALTAHYVAVNEGMIKSGELGLDQFEEDVAVARLGRAIR
jgi:hypothetical protein